LYLDEPRSFEPLPVCNLFPNKRSTSGNSRGFSFFEKANNMATPTLINSNPTEGSFMARLPDNEPNSVKLKEELTTVAQPNFDAKVRFETRAYRGDPSGAVALLDRLDSLDRKD
jgi:hypothetical protein